MSHPTRNDVGSYVIHECLNCGMPEKDHLVVGTKLQCLFAPGTAYNDLPSNAWLKQAEAGPGGWDHRGPVHVSVIPPRQRTVSTWTPGSTEEGEI